MTGPAPKRMSREAGRAALLDAAADVVRAPEGDGLSFEAVAAAAGVSATLPYKYFESVDEIADVLELIDELRAIDGLDEGEAFEAACVLMLNLNEFLHVG